MEFTLTCEIARARSKGAFHYVVRFADGTILNERHSNRTYSVAVVARFKPTQHVYVAGYGRDERAAQSTVNATRRMRDTEVVGIAKLTDPRTGQALTDRVLSRTATVFNSDGKLASRGVVVIQRDGYITIGVTSYPETELTLTGDVILHPKQGWTVFLSDAARSG